MNTADCTWDSPGANPYRGPPVASVTAALDRYNISPAAKVILVERVRTLQPTATLTITRDGVHSPDGTATDLRDMHYGKNRMCSGPVLRTEWKADHAESALLYCALGECIAIPTVCGNVSRVTWVPTPVADKEEPAIRAPGKAPRLAPAPAPFQVPEPSSRLLALVALVIALRFLRR